MVSHLVVPLNQQQVVLNFKNDNILNIYTNSNGGGGGLSFGIAGCRCQTNQQSLHMPFQSWSRDVTSTKDELKCPCCNVYQTRKMTTICSKPKVFEADQLIH